MRTIEVNSYEELLTKEKEVLGSGFRYYDTEGKYNIYYKSCHKIRIKCNFWK